MADLIRISLFGSLPAGEEWSVNPVWKVTTGSVISYAECTAIATAINAATIPTGVRFVMNSSCSVTGVRVEARSAAGTLEAQAEALRGTPVFGSASTALPYQSALVVSLRTAAPGGRGRGRMYWPATGAALSGSTLRYSTADTATFLTAMKTYLATLTTAIDGAVDETVALGVWSRTGASVAEVNRVMVGDIIDTQRRRRDALPESYAEAAWP